MKFEFALISINQRSVSSSKYSSTLMNHGDQRKLKKLVEPVLNSVEEEELEEGHLSPALHFSLCHSNLECSRNASSGFMNMNGRF